MKIIELLKVPLQNCVLIVFLKILRKLSIFSKEKFKMFLGISFIEENLQIFLKDFKNQKIIHKKNIFKLNQKFPKIC